MKYNDHVPDFEWDSKKEAANLSKHGVSFEEAIDVFFDPHRVIVEDVKHSQNEARFYCYGKSEGEILTVRFTPRAGKIRIIGAAYWREGKKAYEKENRIRKKPVA